MMRLPGTQSTVGNSSRTHITHATRSMSAFSRLPGGYRDDLVAGAAEEEYLDAVFDTAALEREVNELTGFGDTHGRGSNEGGNGGGGPTFSGFTSSHEVLDRIEEVRKLQQRVFHSHLKVEVNLNNFVQGQSADVSKAEASAKVCRDFRNEFDAKKNIMEDVSELLSELAEKVDGVNELVADNMDGRRGRHVSSEAYPETRNETWCPSDADNDEIRVIAKRGSRTNTGRGGSSTWGVN